MNVLIIDKDALVRQLMTSKLEQMGHKVTGEENKNLAIRELGNKTFDCIFIDPSPLINVRPIVFDVFKSLRKGAERPYIVLLSKEATKKDAIAGFCNDLLRKPLDHKALETLMGNAVRLRSYYKILEGDTKDIPMGNSFGIIDQNAFRQLFLSSIDRGFRYAEQNFVLFVQITNLKDIFADIGDKKTYEVLDMFAEKISWTRRQSDVVGRVAMDMFGVLLQRPMYETEISDAYSRFKEKTTDISSEITKDLSLSIALKTKVSVVELPFCGLSFK